MPPSFLNFKELRRRSRASFRGSHSNDSSSDGGHSVTATPTSGSLTPPSENPDAILDLPSRSQTNLSSSAPTRPPLQNPNGGNTSKRSSVSGMAGLGSPS